MTRWLAAPHKGVPYLLVLLAAAAPAYAQQARPSPLAIDTVASVDESVDEQGNFTTGVVVDAVVSMALGGGFEAITRPFAQRLPSGEWNRQVWVAAIRYQHSGPIGVRVDAGLIPSPVGLANLSLRPNQNPNITLPASLFTPLPPVDLRGGRPFVLGITYPYGVNVTVSSAHWDVRGAVIDVSPLRIRRIFGDPNPPFFNGNPPRFTNVVVGGGVTPIVGLRVGTSVTRGGWQRAGENPFVTVDRDATVFTIESEYSVRYTKLAGEWVREFLETNHGDDSACGWWVQGQQTLSPRWFAAGRVERMTGPTVGPLDALTDLHFTGVEETIGYRLSPEITLRAGHRAREAFGRSGFDNVAQVSVVWWRRWL